MDFKIRQGNAGLPHVEHARRTRRTSEFTSMCKLNYCNNSAAAVHSTTANSSPPFPTTNQPAATVQWLLSGVRPAPYETHARWSRALRGTRQPAVWSAVRMTTGEHAVKEENEQSRNRTKKHHTSINDRHEFPNYLTR